jgi:hypothetical protein
MRFYLLLTASVCLFICGCQKTDCSKTACPEKSFSYVKKLDLLYNENFAFSREQDLQLFYNKLREMAEQMQSEQNPKLTGAMLCKAIERYRSQAQSRDLVSMR